MINSIFLLTELTHCNEPHALHEYQADVVDSIPAEVDPALRRRLPGFDPSLLMLQKQLATDLSFLIFVLSIRAVNEESTLYNISK